MIHPDTALNLRNSPNELNVDIDGTTLLFKKKIWPA